MSQSVTIDGHAEPEPRREDPAQRRTEPAVAIEDAPRNAADDADAVREATEAMSRVTTAEAETRRANNEAAAARNEAARANRGRIDDQRAMLAGAVQAADSELSRAKTAFKAAFDAGDADAMASAQEAIGSATYRKANASGQLASMGEPQQQRTQQTQQDQQQPVWTPGPRARQWLSEHPRMDNDREYQSTASLAHSQAVGRGYKPETDQYFEHVNRVMDAAYGAGHANGSGGGPQMSGNREQGNGGGQQSHAAPSNRGGGGNNSGWKPVRTGLGVLNVAEAGGKMRISFPDPSVRDNMEEGAKICYPDQWSKDPGAALAAYAGEQVKIAREMEAGGDAGMTPMGEGRTYR